MGSLFSQESPSAEQVRQQRIARARRVHAGNRARAWVALGCLLQLLAFSGVGPSPPEPGALYTAFQDASWARCVVALLSTVVCLSVEEPRREDWNFAIEVRRYNAGLTALVVLAMLAPPLWYIGYVVSHIATPAILACLWAETGRTMEVFDTELQDIAGHPASRS